MDYLLNFFNPISIDLQLYCDTLSDSVMGNYIKKYSVDHEPLLLKKSVVIIGIPSSEDILLEQSENALKNIRRELYALHVGNWESNIIDLGNLKVEDDTDLQTLIQELLVTLIKNQMVPVLIGGSQALTYNIYRSFDDLEKKVNLTVVDPSFDLGLLSEPLSHNSYLTHIIMDKPNNLMNYVNLGYQTYLNAQEEIELLDKMYFETYRLGILKKDITLVEPVLRESDIISIDLDVLKASEIPNNNLPNINGFTTDELCQISRYAGVSDYLSVFSVFNEKIFNTNDSYISQVVAQMIWYFIDGYHFRINEFPDEHLLEYKKYNVLIDDETITFYKSNMSNRWWMEINVFMDNNLNRKTLIPCTYKDYLSATNKQIPDRWYLNRKKMNF